MNYILQVVVIVFLLVSGCVGPPSYEDGLLENIPAVVNEPDYFSLSILGDEYSEKKEWDFLDTYIVKIIRNITANETNYTTNYYLT